MSETSHPAQRLRQAEIAFDMASRRATQLDKERSLWRRLSPRRFATLSGILNLLEEAAGICNEAGSDTRSPLATAIRELHTRTRRQFRNVLITFGVIAVAVLALGVIILWVPGILPRGHSPTITDPRAGDQVDMSIPVSGSFPGSSLPPGTYFYLLVKPQGFNYWVQLPPNAIPPKLGRAGWRAAKVGVGQPGDVGMPFRICAILTGQPLSPGWNAPDLPAGDAHCIDVTRR